MKETIVILGNGFDIALGMKSSYKDFYESDFWPFKKETKDESKRMFGIDVYLNDNMKDNWYNLENLLADYASKIKSIHPDLCAHDKDCFFKLKSALSEFIDKAQREMDFRGISYSNKAKRFLQSICANRTPIIYSFNYSNLKALAYLCDIENLNYIAVHGTIENQDIVVGIEDNIKIPREYDFLKKVSEPTYKSNNLVYDLSVAKEVFIFGHSLGKNDYHFFRQFFKMHSNETNIDPNNKCKITIITANAESRMDILANLRAMNKGKNNQLFAQNELKFIRTVGNDRIIHLEFEDWIQEITS